MTVKIFGRLVPRTFVSERRFQIFIQESMFDFLPRAMKKPVYKMYLKDQLYEMYGPTAFLFPEERLFPVKNINTGLFDCRLIQYSVIRTLALRRISSDYEHFYDAAVKCFDENGCKESVSITLVDDNKTVPLITFLRELDELGGTADIDVPILPKQTQEDLRRTMPHFKGHYKKYKRLAKTATKRI